MKRLAEAETATLSPIESAKEAGLRYASDEGPGIRRVKRGEKFAFVDAAGKPVRDAERLARIKSLVIPPAWADVWISPFENGHLQATGRDARGRKQHRYHPGWRVVRDGSKYERMMAFGRALPGIRKRIARDLASPGLSREKVLATVVRLLETTFIRVGNEEYARTNKSYGLTTLRDRHAKISGDRITFTFRGKSGKDHTIDVRDRELARLVKRCQELPGQEIFQYVDAQGKVVDIKSQDVNAYLREVAGVEFTAKDFRTWGGTVLAAVALREFQRCTCEKEAKGNIVRAIESVAKTLGNTPTICRKCYVHPAILDSYLDGNTIATLQQRSARALTSGLHRLKPEEAAVMVLLQESLSGARKRARTKVGELMAPARGAGGKASRRKTRGLAKAKA